MPPWKLQISQSVLKDLRGLPKEVRGRAALSILELASTPYPHAVQKVKGYERTYRVRAGDYRIVYEVAGDEVAIIAVSHGKDVYRELK